MNIFQILDRMDLHALLDMGLECPENFRQLLPDGSNALHFLMEKLRTMPAQLKNPYIKTIVSYIINQGRVNPFHKRTSDEKTPFQLYQEMKLEILWY